MGSIGNDIVALKTTDAGRTVTPRFYNKILSPTDLQLYHATLAAIPLHYFVWLAWSVKEAAYKCLQRSQTNLVFSPVRMEIADVRPDLSSPGLVATAGLPDHQGYLITLNFNDQTLYAQSKIFGDDLIHTIVSFKADFSAVESGVKQIGSAEPEIQSASVRTFLLDRLSVLYPSVDISIDKDAAGIPFIAIGDEVVPVSLSHHDSWIGYAF